MIRKIMSSITLQRTDQKTKEYLSECQSAYSQFRSTSRIAWMHRWLICRIEIYQERFLITGIDMSPASDIINRARFKEIVKTFLEEEEVRIIRYLLSNSENQNQQS